MLKLLGRLYLFLFGWKPGGERPAARKYVLVAAPHTSYWDMPHMVALSWVFGIRLHWMGKHTIFRGPASGFFKALGGIPVDRRSPQGLVRQMADEFACRESFVLSVPPEGTRARRDYWKSGFYQIAREANVPIVLGYLDFGRKVGGFGDPLPVTGDVVADMDRVRAFYRVRGITGKHPELFTPPRLRLEEDPAAADTPAPPPRDVEALRSEAPAAA